MLLANNFRNLLLLIQLALSTLCIASWSSNISRADVIFSLDLDHTQPGIQADRRTEPGEIFDAYVNLTLTGDTQISGYTFTIKFRPDEVNILSVDDSLRPAGWFSLSPPVRNEQESWIELINAANLFDSIDSSFSGPIARLTLQARNPILHPLSANLTPGLFTPFDGVLDETGAAISSGIEFHDGTVTVVPEPSTASIICLAAGIASLPRRLRRTKAQANKSES